MFALFFHVILQTNQTAILPNKQLNIIDMKSHEIIDQRTKEQKITHNVLITATDRFLSGWGRGVSKCAWACKREHADKVFTWVDDRSDMKYVNMNFSGKWYPKAAHVKIYVVDEDHPALIHNLNN